MDIGSVVALASRKLRSAPPASFERLVVRAGVGIDGDIHADAFSPRQLLLAGADAYAAFALPPHALRENLLIDADTAQLASGTVLQIGSEVRLRMMFQCEACGQLDTVEPGLAARIGTSRGMLARVVTGGPIQRGDPVRQLGVFWPEWSNDWRQRVLRVLDALPANAVIEYRQLARLAGIQSSYCRAFPRMIERLGERYVDKAVASNSPVARVRWQGDGLFARW